LLLGSCAQGWRISNAIFRLLRKSTTQRAAEPGALIEDLQFIHAVIARSGEPRRDRGRADGSASGSAEGLDEDAHTGWRRVGRPVSQQGML